MQHDITALNLEFDPAPEFEAVRKRLSAIDRSRFGDIVELLGVRESGQPIRVVLAAENSEWSRLVSSWTAGFAISRQSLIVIFPTRTPSYPHSSLEDVLRHELAHIWIARSSGNRNMPRWFNEGLSMLAERNWDFEDRGRNRERGCRFL